MDTRTGHIHETLPGESVEQMAQRLATHDQFKRTVQQLAGDLTEIKRKPDPKCPYCHGTGAIPKGHVSKRFKPCRCTQ